MQTLTLKRWISSISILSLLSLIVSLALLLYGSDALKPYDALIGLKSFFTGNIQSETVKTILFQVRLPRIILALITGGALATAGAGFQAILKNPLADPYVLGISSGAALGVIVSLYLGVFISIAGISSTMVFAFAGAMLTLYIVYRLGTVDNKIPPHTMLLSGVMVNAIIFAAILMVVSISDSLNLYKILFWLLGYLSSPDYLTLLAAFIFAFIGALILFSQAKSLNILTMDDDTAATLGLNVERIKKLVLVGGALLVAASVSICGPISFIGIMIPHTIRLLAGYDYRFILPVSMIGGGVFLAVADTVARTLLSPAEIPVGIITALAGGPFFLYLLRTRRLI
ncbi:MAG: iron ABC transporter permease [Nitrospirae bacterium]|nr:iron ABC transporter permease [Nitrospirota bacterium]